MSVGFREILKEEARRSPESPKRIGLFPFLRYLNSPSIQFPQMPRIVPLLLSVDPQAPFLQGRAPLNRLLIVSLLYLNGSAIASFIKVGLLFGIVKDIAIDYQYR